MPGGGPEWGKYFSGAAPPYRELVLESRGGANGPILVLEQVGPKMLMRAMGPAS